MLEYQLGQVDKVELILTLTEKTTTTEPIYVFTFTHMLTKQTVSFVKTTKDDKSFFPERYNLFEIYPGTLFNQVGEWHYVVTEQEAGTLLETGIMNIKSDFNFTMYNGATSYTAYNG